MTPRQWWGTLSHVAKGAGERASATSHPLACSKWTPRTFAYCSWHLKYLFFIKKKIVHIKTSPAIFITALVMRAKTIPSLNKLQLQSESVSCSTVFNSV